MIQLKAIPKNEVALSLPFFGSRIACGFPSPVDDYLDNPLDLNEYLIKHEAATYFCWVQGDSMEGQGIHDGDLLVVDRALEARHGSVVVVAVGGEFTCKKLDLHNRQLVPCNPAFQPIPITEELDMVIEGVVVYSIRKHIG